MSEDLVHTLLVILLFTAMVLAPVLVAHFFGARATRKRKTDSGSHAAFQITDPVPPKVTHHLRPKPRKRGLR